MASICCSPPDSLCRGSPCAHEAPGRLVDPLETPAVVVDDGRQREVLGDGQRGIDPAVVGNPADAQPRPAVRRPLVQLDPSNVVDPCTCLCSPMMQRSRVVLPAPLRPTRVTTSPGATSMLTSESTRASPYQAETPATSSDVRVRVKVASQSWT